MHSELVEWRISRELKGVKVFHSEGAQSVFSLSRARKIVKELGKDWDIRHAQTQDHPKDN